MLYILRGLPASGKSTWRKEKGYPYVNKDELRMYNPTLTERQIHQKQMDILNLLAGENEKHIIIDNTNLNEHTVNQYFAWASDNEYDVQIIDFLVDVEECVNRDKARANSVGASVIRNMAIQHNLVSLGNTYIFDIDGTLADLEHRKHLLPKSGESWLPFFDKQDKDTVKEDVARIFRQLKANGFYIVCVSGRPDSHRAMTWNWLVENDLEPYTLLMRDKRDHSPDYMVKKSLYDRYLKNTNVLGVFDDRDSVIKMWRETLGLTCFQVAYGDF